MKDSNLEFKVPELDEASKTFIEQRSKELVQKDSQFRESLPLAEITEARAKPGLCLAQTIDTCMKGYADRTAVARRATELRKDAATGRNFRVLQDSFESLTYRQLWSRAKSLAGFWYRHKDGPLRADQFLCILGFSGVDFTTVYLAAIYSGAVTVPLQTNAKLSNLLEVTKETEPQWLATSLEHLDATVELVLQGYCPKGLLLFDYDSEVDDHREVFEKAQSKLAESGKPEFITTIEDACSTGATLAPAPLFEQSDANERLCQIIYTSGSTGTPKGAMLQEKLVKYSWLTASTLPWLYMHYMPMNHSFGIGTIGQTLGLGGTVFFTAKSDLSTLFEDIQLVRPTFIPLVPRVCEILFDQFQNQPARRESGGQACESCKDDQLLEFRNNNLGGRVLGSIFSSAPLSPDLKTFMDQLLGFRIINSYGATEILSATINNKILRPPVTDYKLVDVPELGYFSTDKPYPRGELWLKTDALIMGYYKRPETTASVMSDDGYYMTGDIMAEIGPDQVVYLDRRNNVQKLSQGEFVAVSRIEVLLSYAPLIHQAYLYGSSERSFLVAVIVPNPDVIRESGIEGNDQEIKEALRNAINQVAHDEDLLAHEVPRDFVVEYEPFSPENDLLTGVGKPQRLKLKEKYSEKLEVLYDHIAAEQNKELVFLRQQGKSLPVTECIARAVKASLGLEDLDFSKGFSFIELGGDSLTALSCSLLLEEIYGIEVPAGVINNPAGSLQQLAQYIVRGMDASFQRPSFSSVHGKDATEIHVKDLVLEKFIDEKTLDQAASLPGPSEDIKCVLVTGASGFLGRFLCLEWLERMEKAGGKVVCVIRGKDNRDACNRLQNSMDSNDLVLMQHFDSLAADHLEVLAGDISEANMGLNQEDWQRLATTVDHIVHPAAFVNHVLPYAQLFGPNLVGTTELIRLALTHHIKPFNNVSTVAVCGLPEGGAATENDDIRKLTPVRDLTLQGYARGYADSKWAAEVLLADANDRFNLPVTNFRCDMILPHSEYKGQLNVPDMFTRWLFSTVVTGLAPKSCYETTSGEKPHYDGLPADFIAEAIATLGEHAREGNRCYHVVNPHEDGISLDSFVDWAIDAGYKIDKVEDYNDWFHRFETALRALPDEQGLASSIPLLHQLEKPAQVTIGAMFSAESFHEDVRKYRIGKDNDIPHLTPEFIRKYLEDIKQVGLI